MTNYVCMYVMLWVPRQGTYSYADEFDCVENIWKPLAFSMTVNGTKSLFNFGKKIE